MRRRLVGITLLLRERESIWSCGATQNVIHLARCLGASPALEVVVATEGARTPPPGLCLDGSEGVRFAPLADVLPELDLLVEAGLSVSAETHAAVRSRGGRTVAYRFGNTAWIDTERILFGRGSGAIINGAVYDELWTHAHHLRSSGSYWRTMHRCPIRVLTHLWDRLWLDRCDRGLRARTPPSCVSYSPRRSAARVGIFEPNISTLKNFATPLLVAELAHRMRPDLVGDVYVHNAAQFAGHVTFDAFLDGLDLAAAGKLSVEERPCLPVALAAATDAVVSWQQENALNYAYYEALSWGGILVHNSDLLPDGVGYRYRGFDAEEGARVLVSALLVHDANLAAYRARASRFLATLGPLEPAVVAEHEAAVLGLW